MKIVGSSNPLWLLPMLHINQRIWKELFVYVAVVNVRMWGESWLFRLPIIDLVLKQVHASVILQPILQTGSS